MRLNRIVNQYHIHDARDIATFLPQGRECIDVTITSPPYWNLKDYGVRRQIGFRQSYESYLDDIENVFTSIYRATKDSGSLWIVTDTFKQDGELRLLPFDISARLRKTGWLLQDIIIWQKDRTLPWSHQGKLRNIFEYVALYSKTRAFKYHVDGVRDMSDVKDYWVRYPERYAPEGKTPSRMWRFAIPRQGIWGENGNYVRHACPLPAELIERMLLLTTDPGDVVLDPFAGSGAVLATASALDRRFIGTDLNVRFRRMFHDRVLPTVETRQKSRSIGQEEHRLARVRFAATVRGLRCLKYPKELVRLYRQRHGKLECSAAWVLPSRDRRSIHVVFVVPRNQRLTGSFGARAQALIAERPLSKYGLVGDISVVRTASELRQRLTALGLRPRSRIHVYENGRFFYSSACHSLDAILRAASLAMTGQRGRSRHPTIFSPIKVQVDRRNPGKVFLGA